MIGTIVYKLTGSGNDFVFVDGRLREPAAWTAEEIRALCDRHRGVGADGFAVVEPGSGPGKVRFHFFNDDGGRAPMCGNGALCATRIAAHLELANPAGMVLETDAGSFRSRCLDGPGELAELVLGDLPAPRPVAVTLQAGEHEAHLAVVGVPHLVVLVDDVAAVDLIERGRALRWDPALGAAGANVNFVSPSQTAPRRSGRPAAAGSGAPSDPPGPPVAPAGRGRVGWAMRTYERGVEGETLACGTGAVACASVLALSGRTGLPQELNAASGASLGVAGCAQGGSLRRAALRGESRLVFTGVVGWNP